MTPEMLHDFGVQALAAIAALLIYAYMKATNPNQRD